MLQAAASKLQPQVGTTGRSRFTLELGIEPAHEDHIYADRPAKSWPYIDVTTQQFKGVRRRTNGVNLQVIWWIYLNLGDQQPIAAVLSLNDIDSLFFLWNERTAFWRFPHFQSLWSYSLLTYLLSFFVHQIAADFWRTESLPLWCNDVKMMVSIQQAKLRFAIESLGHNLRAPNSGDTAIISWFIPLFCQKKTGWFNMRSEKSPLLCRLCIVFCRLGSSWDVKWSQGWGPEFVLKPDLKAHRPGSERPKTW